VQVVRDCRVAAGIKYNSGQGAIDSIVGNTIDSVGIDYKSGISDAYIGHNVIIEGRIHDRSGYGEQRICYNQITCTGAYLDEYGSACILAEGASDLITHNELFAHNGVHGIYARSGYPTYIDSNTVRVSGGGIGIHTVSGAGQVVGNWLIGGSYGLVDSSGALLVAYNVIDSCDIGAVTHSAARYLGNIITNCVTGGMIVDFTGHAVDSNVVTGNGGVGVSVRLQTKWTSYGRKLSHTLAARNSLLIRSFSTLHRS